MREKQMTFEDIKDRACFDKGMPGDAGNFERALYRGLQCIYWLFRHEAIAKDDAIAEMRLMKSAYESECKLYEMFQEEARRYCRIRGIASDIEKHGSEDAKRLIRIMDGKERIIDNDENSEEHSFEQVTMPQV